MSKSLIDSKMIIKNNVRPRDKLPSSLIWVINETPAYLTDLYFPPLGVNQGRESSLRLLHLKQISEL